MSSSSSSSLIRFIFGAYLYFLFSCILELFISSIYFLDGYNFFPMLETESLDKVETYSFIGYSFILPQFYFRSCQAFAFSPPPCFSPLKPPFSFYSIFLRICNCYSLSATFPVSLSLKSYSSELFFAPLSAHSAISPISLSMSTAFFSGSAFLVGYGFLPRLCIFEPTFLIVLEGSLLLSLCCDFQELVEDDALFILPTILDSATKFIFRKSSSISSWYLLSRILGTLPTILLFSPSYRSPKSSPNMERERLRGLEQSSSAILNQILIDYQYK